MGWFIVTGRICQGDDSGAWLLDDSEANAGCDANAGAKKTLLSTDYGQTFEEKAAWPDAEEYIDACAVFLDDTQVRCRQGRN